MAQPATEPARAAQGPGTAPPVRPVDEELPLARLVPAGLQQYLAPAGSTLAALLLLQRFGRGFLKQLALLIGLFGSIAVSGIRTLSEAGLAAGSDVINLFFHHLGTRSRPAVALKSS